MFVFLETNIRSAVKTTQADLVSNFGGVLDISLEVSFVNAYGFHVYSFDVIFKLEIFFGFKF